MAWLMGEILGSLVLVALAAFAAGWILRGLRDRIPGKGHRPQERAGETSGSGEDSS